LNDPGEAHFDRSVHALVNELAEPSSAAAGGVAAAAAAGMAAGLVAMVAGASTERWPEAAGAMAQADSLVARARRLADEASAAFAEARAALRPPDGRPATDAQIGYRVNAALEPPLHIAELAADSAALAAACARSGEPDLRADAVVAALIASGCARAAAHLVEVNLLVAAGDPTLARAQEAAAAAEQASAATLADG
jgi:methenyltetrahydrofolate cyclohydrolase